MESFAPVRGVLFAQDSACNIEHPHGGHDTFMANSFRLRPLPSRVGETSNMRDLARASRRRLNTCKVGRNRACANTYRALRRTCDSLGSEGGMTSCVTFGTTLDGQGTAQVALLARIAVHGDRREIIVP